MEEARLGVAWRVGQAGIGMLGSNWEDKGTEGQAMNDIVEETKQAATRSVSLIVRTAERFGVEPGRMLETLKGTAFRTDQEITNEQMMGLLIVAEAHRLNPFTKELFAFLDKRGVIVPYISIDGWSRIVNEHPQFDGWAFDYDGKEQAMTCTIWRKDRSHPCVVTEYMSECRRNTQPWTQSPRRMLRHKALMQCARLAFGFAGIYDEDEARRIRDMGTVDEVMSDERSSAQRVRSILTGRPSDPEVIEHEVQEENDEAPLPARSMQQYVEDIRSASDVETASLVLDEARSVVDDETHRALAMIWRERWTPKE